MLSVSMTCPLFCDEKKEGEEGEDGEEGREGKEGRKGGEERREGRKGGKGREGEGEEGEEGSQLDLWTIQKDFDQCGLSWPPLASLSLLLSPILVVIKS